MKALFPELVQARKRARRDSELAAAFHACGLDLDGLPIVWGVDLVSAHGAHYEPCPGGRAALIIPAVEYGQIIDLVAMGVRTFTCKTRSGLATMLGREWLNTARWAGVPPVIFDNPMTWLRARCRGSVFVDPEAARFELADIPTVACANDKLAAQLDELMRRSVPVPAFYVPEARRAAV